MKLNKKILVVGGAGGIGSTIVKKYASGGNMVIVGDKTLKGDTNEFIKEYYVNVLDYDSIKSFREKVENEHNTITHIISLAGGALPEEFGGINETSKEVFSKSIDLNLKSHGYLMKEFLPLLENDKNKDKSITFVSSINAIKDYGLPAYSAAKAGLLGLMNATIRDMGNKGIRINTLLPGTVLTPRTAKEPKDFETLEQGTALGRLTTPEEIANVVYSLTHLMTCVTGQGIVADCGQSKLGTQYIKK